MQRFSIALIFSAMLAGAILCGFQACDTLKRGPETPDRKKCPNAFHTIKWKKIVCSKCHVDEDPVFFKRLQP